MVDDELKIPQGSDDNYLRKLRDRHTGHRNFIPYIASNKNARAKSTFGIKHFAGEVFYDTTDFMAKNRDSLPVNLERVCGAAKHSFVGRELFENSCVHAGWRGRGRRAGQGPD
jgi:myosin heavy subunit